MIQLYSHIYPHFPVNIKPGLMRRLGLRNHIFTTPYELACAKR